MQSYRFRTCRLTNFVGVEEDLKMTRQKLEKTFRLLHYCIVEITILTLAIIGAWKLISRG